jgi:hypothetical protein
MKGIKMENTKMGKKHKNLIEDISEAKSGACLIPFIDLCNHKNSRDPKGMNRTDFLMSFRKNYVTITFTSDFKKGEDYEYSYLPSTPNEKLLSAYGFYIDHNPQSVTAIYMSFAKQHFPKSKYEICLTLDCFNVSFDEFYAKEHLKQANLQILLMSHTINDRILNAFRLYVYPNEIFEPNLARERLKKGKWIFYEIEIKALALYRDVCNNYHTSALFKLVI